MHRTAIAARGRRGNRHREWGVVVVHCWEASWWDGLSGAITTGQVGGDIVESRSLAGRRCVLESHPRLQFKLVQENGTYLLGP